MLVYGDIERQVTAAALCGAISASLESLAGQEPGLARHAALVRIFIAAGELVQGLADHEFRLSGLDRRSRRQDAGATLLLLLARAVRRSWRSGFEAAGLDPGIASLLEALHGPDEVTVTRAEGFGLYALYPESYLEAAQASGLGPDTAVIGIRSIGAALAAMVAAALGAGPAVTIRPVGHPFGRQVAAAPELTREMTADRARRFAVVDEGPGLSGSSFAAVAQWLEQAGVARERIVFFPSHGGGPGSKAAPQVLSRWEGRARFHGSFETLLLRPADPAHRLQAWVEGVVGPLTAPLEDIAGGGWRRLRGPEEARWPPADARLERRKFLARTADGRYLVKFAGLGVDGPRKLAVAQGLAEAGHCARPAGLCHGFLVEQWLDGAPLDRMLTDRAPVDRERLIAALASYLGFRAARLPPPGGGASLQDLAEMACHNAALALGAEAGAAMRGALADAATLEPRLRRIDTDGRLHGWEWLVRADGGLVKTDALDHSTGHDLIGCQDVAWDIAGAFVEHELSHEELARLCDGVAGAGGGPVDRLLVRFALPCYLAFQLGLWSMARDEAGDPSEKVRLAAQAGRYAGYLAGWLSRQDRPL